jgi:hypothetical protein
MLITIKVGYAERMRRDLIQVPSKVHAGYLPAPGAERVFVLIVVNQEEAVESAHWNKAQFTCFSRWPGYTLNALTVLLKKAVCRKPQLVVVPEVPSNHETYSTQHPKEPCHAPIHGAAKAKTEQSKKDKQDGETSSSWERNGRWYLTFFRLACSVAWSLIGHAKSLAEPAAWPSDSCRCVSSVMVSTNPLMAELCQRFASLVIAFLQK